MLESFYNTYIQFHQMAQKKKRNGRCSNVGIEKLISLEKKYMIGENFKHT